jgi:hypothetical protein
VKGPCWWSFRVAGTVAAVGLGAVAAVLNETPLVVGVAIELAFVAVAAFASRLIRSRPALRKEYS